MVNRFSNTSILSRLLFWFLVVGLLPLGIVTLILFNTSQEIIRSELESKLQTTADGKISQIETYALERTQDVVGLAKIPTIIQSLSQFSIILESDGATSEAYIDTDQAVRPLLLSILDNATYQDLMLFSTEGELLFSILPTPNIGKRYQDTDPNSPLVQTLENARTLLETEISRLSLSPDTNDTLAFIAAPVFEEGVVIGMLALKLESENLFSVISERTGLSLGETGESIAGFLDSGQLVFAAPTFHNPDGAFTPILSFGNGKTNPMEDAVRGIQGKGIIQDYRNQEVIAVWNYLPSLRWGLMVKIDTSEAFGAVSGQQTLVFGLGVLTLLAVIAISYTLANSLSSPIKNLVRATQTVAKGVYENKIMAQGRGEIGQLVDAFDLLINNTIAQRTEELKRVAEQERENNRLKDEFMAVMSHELRTPLNAIIGFLGIIQQKAELDEKNMHRISRSRANAERLLGLINDILDVSRIQSGRVQVFKRPMEVRVFFERLQTQMLSLAEAKNLTFTLTIAPDMPAHIATDEELLTKIFINLIGNAFKFTELGGIEVSVTKDNDDTWTTLVKDTGVGIPPHMHEVVFERFRQIDSSPTRRHGGTGLGLSIVNSLIQTLEGKLKLESVVNQGSSFFVTLPLEVASPENKQVLAESSQSNDT